MSYKKRRAIIAIIALVLVFGVLTAEAGVSFIGSVKVGGGSVESEGKAAGCGNGNCDYVEMITQGNNLQAWCQNPGLKVVPGQSPVSIYVYSASTFEVDANGTFNFNIHQEILPDPNQANCPNGKWQVIDLTGQLTVTLNLYETGVASPADVQVFTCDAVFDTVANCVRIQ